MSTPLKLLLAALAVLVLVCVASLLHQQWRKSRLVLIASSLSESEVQARRDADRRQRLHAAKVALLENTSSLPKFVRLNTNTEYGFQIFEDQDLVVCIFGPNGDRVTTRFTNEFIEKNREEIQTLAGALGERLPQGAEDDLAEDLLIGDGFSPDLVAQYWEVFAPLEFFVDRESDCIVIYTKKPAGFVYAGYKGYTKMPESVGRNLKMPSTLSRTW